MQKAISKIQCRFNTKRTCTSTKNILFYQTRFWNWISCKKEKEELREFVWKIIFGTRIVCTSFYWEMNGPSRLTTKVLLCYSMTVIARYSWCVYPTVCYPHHCRLSWLVWIIHRDLMSFITHPQKPLTSRLLLNGKPFDNWSDFISIFQDTCHYPGYFNIIS